jgi:hypothetical protein
MSDMTWRVLDLLSGRAGGFWPVGRQTQSLPQDREGDRGSADALEAVKVMLQVSQEGHDPLSPGMGPTDFSGWPVI